jgi:hypothetical protein
MEMTRLGFVNATRTKSGRPVFGEFSEGSKFNIPAPGGGSSIKHVPRIGQQ